MVVPQQPAYGQHGFAMHEGNAGVGVPQIVRPDIPKAGFRPHVLPEIGDSREMVQVPPMRGKDPCAFPRQPVQDLPRGVRKPDRARAVLAIPKEDFAFPVIPPFEGQQLALSTPRQ